MPRKLNPQTQKQLAAYVDYYRDMGIYDFYQRPIAENAARLADSPSAPMPAAEAATDVVLVTREESLFDSPLPVIQDKPAALKLIREDIGDCTRCRLHKSRKNIVFGVGNVNADIMFVGEGPGADEDEQGEPFVGRAGQLLNNMI